jgi:Putative peptidoglycan binding domain/D-alanyl-D-alanine carboxypeptidase
LEAKMTGLTKEVSIPAGVNAGLGGTSNKLALALLGNPRSNYNADCQPVTNPGLAAKMVSGIDVGPFRVSGFGLAVDSLKLVMADIKAEQRAVFDVLSTAGMLCARLVRGSKTSISNHSWGLAIDLKIEGVLDERGDGKVQFGLTLIAPIFNRHGWYWGATFPTEDGMHFEISEQKLRGWHKDGLLGGAAKPTASLSLMLGDRSDRVKELQTRLNKLEESLEADGVFGPATHSAVVAFQGRNGLSADGIAGSKTWKTLLAQTGG